jgi:O-antigen/teichoic acid export membrane protein
VGVYILTRFDVQNKILWVAIVLGVKPFIVSFLSNIYFFSTIYKSIRPQFLKIERGLMKGTLSHSMSFFIIQLSILVLMSTDNLIIIHIFSPEQVTVYSICYKFFTLFTIGWTTLIMPYWSAFGDAYHKQNFDWIRKTIRRLFRLWLLLNAALLITLFFVNDIYRLWVGETIHVPLSLSILNALFISLFSLANIYIYFINGIGKIRFQLFTSIIIGILNIPLCILFARYFQWGITGVMAATCLCIAVNPMFGYYQYKQLITEKAKGIWLK